MRKKLDVGSVRIPNSRIMPSKLTLKIRVYPRRFVIVNGSSQALSNHNYNTGCAAILQAAYSTTNHPTYSKTETKQETSSTQKT